MAKKPLVGSKEGSGIFTLAGSAVFCGRCGKGIVFTTGHEFYRCNKCNRVFCARCYNNFNSVCLTCIDPQSIEDQEFFKEHGIYDLLFEEPAANIVIELDGIVAHFNTETRKLVRSADWKFDEHLLTLVSKTGYAMGKCDVTFVDKVFTTSPDSKLVKGIKEWNIKFKIKQLPKSETAGAEKKRRAQA